MRNQVQITIRILLAALWLVSGEQNLSAKGKLLDVASDVTSGFYQDYNNAFAAYWKKQTGQTVFISQTNGDAHEQSQSIVDSVDADVVGMDEPTDIDTLFTNGRFLDANWE